MCVSESQIVDLNLNGNLEIPLIFGLASGLQLEMLSDQNCNYTVLRNGATSAKHRQDINRNGRTDYVWGYGWNEVSSFYKKTYVPTLNASDYEKHPHFAFDVDGDGLKDLLSTRIVRRANQESTGNVYVQYQSSPNVFEDRIWILEEPWLFHSAVDFNGDGKLNLLLSRDNSVYTYYGGDVFHKSNFHAIDLDLPLKEWLLDSIDDIQAVDFDNDYDLDLLVTKINVGAFLFYNTTPNVVRGSEDEPKEEPGEEPNDSADCEYLITSDWKISSNCGSELGRVEVYNMLGQLLYRTTVQDSEFSIPRRAFRERHVFVRIGAIVIPVAGY